MGLNKLVYPHQQGKLLWTVNHNKETAFREQVTSHYSIVPAEPYLGGHLPWAFT